MVVCSPPSLRRSGRRDDQAANTLPVKSREFATAPGDSVRPKRSRVSSTSETDNITKRQRANSGAGPIEYKFPLRSRQHEIPLQPLPVKRGTNRSTSDRDRDTSRSILAQQSVPLTSKLHHPNSEKSQSTGEKRTLRSQDGGPRIKSELSFYFADYEQMLSLKAGKPGELCYRGLLHL